MKTKELTWEGIHHRAQHVAKEINRARALKELPEDLVLYGVPRGGIHAVQEVVSVLHITTNTYGRVNITNDPKKADVYIDDLVETGNTRAAIQAMHGMKPFFALVDKEQQQTLKGVWIVFPWEEAKKEEGCEENIVRILESIGEDPKREGLQETPRRVVKSYKTLFGGYDTDPADVLKTFKEDTCDEMVVLRDIEFFSTCEHHMLPFHGTASIAYIPNGKVVGISKLARVLEIYARRLQIQERLTEQITFALDQVLEPLGSACVIKAKHLCMVARGVEKQNSVMVTSSLTGAFRDAVVRQEFMGLVHGS